ncbi:MAG: phosphodiesterase [Gammaproteobacteria bacterium]|nr:phosphodiesterase [Gammaproteobacteria bacterium]MBU1725729.1 phosphodiesterase [Gammaproteobacteria bacterium]MBU2003919.1 phosphodiesterase [Gammaproteobacteria bacterium]
MQTQTPVRLFQITDSHCYPDDDRLLEWVKVPVHPNRSLQAVLAALEAQRSPAHAAVVFSGDLVQEEIAASYQRLNQILNTFPLPIHTIPGNHDIPELMQANLSGNVHFCQPVQLDGWQAILLDSSELDKEEGYLTAQQLDELRQQLAAYPDKHAIVFMHHHPVPVNSPWMDPMRLQQPEAFWAVVADFPQVKAVFCGHLHQEFIGNYSFGERSVPVYATPATCLQLKLPTPTYELDHTRPAWRDIALYPDGTLETRVHYLTLPA